MPQFKKEVVYKFTKNLRIGGDKKIISAANDKLTTPRFGKKNTEEKCMYKKILSLILAFSMPVSSIVFAKDYSGYAQKFYDVDKSHWAFEYISELADKNIINGYSDGSFLPDRTVTRAEWAKLMCVASGKQEVNNISPYAVDYTKNDWFFGYVNAVADYMNFYEDGNKLYFRGNQAISREDVTVSLVKMKGVSVDDVDFSYISQFKDSNSISKNAKKYVAAAVEKGLINGYEDNTFRGQDTLTRAQAAKLLSCASNIGSDNKVTDVTDYNPSGSSSASVTDGQMKNVNNVFEIFAPSDTDSKDDESNHGNDTGSALSKNEKQTESESPEKEEYTDVKPTEKKIDKEYRVEPILETGLQNYYSEKYVVTQAGDYIYFVPDDEKCIKRLNILTNKAENYINFDDNTVSIDNEEYTISEIISLYYNSNKEALCASCTLERYNVLNSRKDTENALINIDNMKLIDELFSEYCFGTDNDGKLIVYQKKYGDEISDGVAILDGPGYYYRIEINTGIGAHTADFYGGKSYPISVNVKHHGVFDVKIINSQMYFFTLGGVYKATDKAAKFNKFTKMTNFFKTEKVVSCSKASIGADTNGFYAINEENLIWLDLNGKVQKSCALSKIDTSECRNDSFPTDLINKMFISSTGDIVFYSLSDEAFMKISKL